MQKTNPLKKMSQVQAKINSISHGAILAVLFYLLIFLPTTVQSFSLYYKVNEYLLLLTYGVAIFFCVLTTKKNIFISAKLHATLCILCLLLGMLSALPLTLFSQMFLMMFILCVFVLSSVVVRDIIEHPILSKAHIYSTALFLPIVIFINIVAKNNLAILMSGLLPLIFVYYLSTNYKNTTHEKKEEENLKVDEKTTSQNQPENRPVLSFSPTIFNIALALLIILPLSTLYITILNIAEKGTLHISLFALAVFISSIMAMCWKKLPPIKVIALSAILAAVCQFVLLIENNVMSLITTSLLGVAASFLFSGIFFTKILQSKSNKNIPLLCTLMIIITPFILTAIFENAVSEQIQIILATASLVFVILLIFLFHKLEFFYTQQTNVIDVLKLKELSHLNETQAKILGLMLKGGTKMEISDHLRLPKNDLENEIAFILSGFGATSMTQLIDILNKKLNHNEKKDANS